MRTKVLVLITALSGCAIQSPTETTEQAVGTHTYTFSMPWFQIANTRAWHTDTDYVTELVTINGNTVGTSQIGMGDLNNGYFNPNLTFGPYTISDTDSVTFSANITNSGYSAGDTPQVLGDISGVIAGIATNIALDDYSTDYITPAMDMMTYVFGVLFPNCDGVVAHPGVGFTGASLAAAVTPISGVSHPVWQQTITSYGTDSPSGCGSNSLYYEHFQILQTDVDVYVPPPDPCAGMISCCGGDVCVAPGHTCPRQCP